MPLGGTGHHSNHSDGRDGPQDRLVANRYAYDLMDVMELSAVDLLVALHAMAAISALRLRM